jgi:hypothetical protein
MDINVKLQGLKYNLGNVWRCFFKKYRAHAIFGSFLFIFLLENPWNRSTAAWTGSMGSDARGLQVCGIS